MTEGDEDNSELIEAELIAPSDVPGYLLLPDVLKDEGRLAYALSFVVNGAGGLHPEWIAVWSTINHVLKTNEFPAIAEVRALKLRK
jgi:hypothetical protein